MRVALYGSRPDGHARVVLEVLLAGHDLEVVALIDDEAENADRHIGELRVVGTRGYLPQLRDQGVRGVLLGFGAANGREAIVNAIEAASLSLPMLIHPSAHISPSAMLSPGTQILPHACVGPGASLGRAALINTGAIVEHNVTIGDCAVVGPGAVVAGRATIGDSVEIGARAVVLPDLAVGRDAIVGAGAVVIGAVPEGQTVVGVPARQLRRGGAGY